jgi:cytochrome oxidase Cu insertion factor (SCO1/SenC/PrrC family)
MTVHRVNPEPPPAAPAGRQWRLIMFTAILLTVILWSVQYLPLIQDVLAHNAHNDDRNPIVPEQRIELSLGRSENYDYDPPPPGSYQLPVLKAAADGAVLDAAGNPQQLHQLLDKHITVLSFIYTRCGDPNGCPLATGLLYKLLFISQQDPVIAENLQLISLSFDPGHDTPQVMSHYGSSVNTPKNGNQTGAGWRFLTTSSAAGLEPILAAYGQTVDRKADAADSFGPYYHMLKLFLIDDQKQIRNIYSLGFLDPRLVMTDIRTLLLEQRNR